jgi:hypothetical protein
MAAPDFSGSWVRDSAKSDPVAEALWLTRSPAPQGQGGRGSNVEAVMTVRQDGDKLLVGFQGETVQYTLDGKAHTSPTATGVEKAVAKANWQGETLVVERSQPYSGMPGNVTLQIKEEWSLSADGKVLVIGITRSFPGVEKTSKQVFHRK